MLDFVIFWDWLAFGVRWLHVITAIAWIGSSFYFVALDLGLRQRPNLPAGAFGEEWQVHGGGFYHIQKYLVAPAEMPEHLTWFKWESYATWLSGFALLCVVYYAGADLFLIDPNVLDVSVPVGIAISLATIGVGWVFYDLLCKLFLGKSDTGLMLFLYCVLVFIAWGLTHLFTGRAAFLHLGAITATIMSANVFMVIIPNQKIVVADLIAGRKPDPKYGKIAKQRSLHNNYLTLPVLFLMLSNHYPLAFGTEFNWVIASLVFIIGVLIRHFFNTQHARKGNPTWTWLAAGILFIVIIWLSTVPKVLTGEAKVSAAGEQYVVSTHFPAVRDTVLGRCAMCHATEPSYEGIYHAPKGVMLDTDAGIAAHAKEIYLQAGRSHAMPPANVTQMTDKERAMLVAWFEEAKK
ncbi:cysteine desulfurase [Mesorhizobium sp. Root157]|uniref:urate hydroxylase PuuD n=1 Tax=Mesorhizobium sp. Root157 TaxID=1736477 RepID=UPI0006F7A9ED|nr:urate hydroxylase PuuD [Mesorhizobium sp. Root157]KQZ93923.1 cysteine desulfurase [Mesorhizobium sp. Root157]